MKMFIRRSTKDDGKEKCRGFEDVPKTKKFHIGHVCAENGLYNKTNISLRSRARGII